MKDGRRDIKRIFFVVWDNFWILWWAEILFVVCCVPVITAPAAFSGLYYSMSELARGEPVEWRTFFYGAKKYFWAGYRWFGFNLLVIGILFFDSYYFFITQGNSGLIWWLLLTGIPFGVLIVWALLNLYTFPFMLVQKKPSFLIAFRNSNVLYIKRPGTVLVFNLLIIIILGLSVWASILWLFIGVSLPVLLSCICLEATKENLPFKRNSG